MCISFVLSVYIDSIACIRSPYALYQQPILLHEYNTKQDMKVCNVFNVTLFIQSI